jgi:lipopolysaccharide export system permease protein
MDRYIVGELAAPFFFGVGAFSSIGLAVGTLFDLVRKITESGLPLAIALQIFLLQMPYFIGLAFPMAMLLASLMAYSRLSKDSEVVALRGCGVSLYRLVLPAVILGLLVTGITFAFNEVLVPTTKYQARTIYEQALNQEKLPFQDENIFYQQFDDVELPNGGKAQELIRLFYAHQFDGQQMRGLVILDFSQENLNQVVTAESATWNPTQNIWNFVNGTIYLVAADGSSRNILRFEQQQLQIPRVPLDLAQPGRDPLEMSIVEAKQQLQRLRQNGNEKEIRQLEIRIQQKYALPFMCVVFGLIGASLGARSQRTSTATGFGISLLIIFVYNLVSLSTDTLGQIGLLSPILSAWLPTLFGLTAGGWLLIRRATH